MKSLYFKFIALFVMLYSPVVAQQNNTIQATTNPSGWIIKTKSSSYQLITDANGNVKPGYYGAA